MRRAARTDMNQTAIFETFRARGFLVWPTFQLGDGFPDCLIVKNGRMKLVEIKNGALSPSRRALTEDEKRVHAAFDRASVEIAIVESVEQAERLEP